jgi:hypothetical protein
LDELQALEDWLCIMPRQREALELAGEVNCGRIPAVAHELAPAGSVIPVSSAFESRVRGSTRGRSAMAEAICGVQCDM